MDQVTWRLLNSSAIGGPAISSFQSLVPLCRLQEDLNRKVWTPEITNGNPYLSNIHVCIRTHVGHTCIYIYIYIMCIYIYNVYIYNYIYIKIILYHVVSCCSVIWRYTCILSEHWALLISCCSTSWLLMDRAKLKAALENHRPPERTLAISMCRCNCGLLFHLWLI